MRSPVLDSSVVQADETLVHCLQPGTGLASTAYLWAILGVRRHPYTTFSFTEDRTSAGPDQFYVHFQGILFSDAYICYELPSADSRAIEGTRESTDR